MFKVGQRWDVSLQVRFVRVWGFLGGHCLFVFLLVLFGLLGWGFFGSLGSFCYGSLLRIFYVLRGFIFLWVFLFVSGWFFFFYRISGGITARKSKKKI